MGIRGDAVRGVAGVAVPAPSPDRSGAYFSMLCGKPASLVDRIDGEAVRTAMLDDFGIEIGTSFGPLRGRIWRIGFMGYNARKQNVLICLGALEAVLRRAGFACKAGAGVEAAYAAYDAAPARKALAS